MSFSLSHSLALPLSLLGFNLCDLGLYKEPFKKRFQIDWQPLLLRMETFPENGIRVAISDGIRMPFFGIRMPFWHYEHSIQNGIMGTKIMLCLMASQEGQIEGQTNGHTVR